MPGYCSRDADVIGLVCSGSQIFILIFLNALLFCHQRTIGLSEYNDFLWAVTLHLKKDTALAQREAYGRIFGSATD